MLNILSKKFFDWLEKVGITPLEDGSRIRRIARDGYEYSEGDHSLIIQADIFNTKYA